MFQLVRTIDDTFTVYDGEVGEGQDGSMAASAVYFVRSSVVIFRMSVPMMVSIAWQCDRGKIT